MADVDGLKVINDTQGHAAGDQSLRALATALHEAGRLGDLAYRVGGDEFLLVLPETGAGEIDVILERVAISDAPSFTWGSASYPETSEEPDALFEVADRQLLARRDGFRSGPHTGRRTA